MKKFLLLFLLLANPAFAADASAPYYAPLFLAIDKRYFAEDGIEVELIQAGGGVATLRSDPLGKSFAQMLLDCPVRVPRHWIDNGLVKP